MKRTHFLILLLTLLSLSACQDHLQPAIITITGNWAGTFETLQTGQCGWRGDASIPAPATWQVVNNTVSGTVNRQFGQFNNLAQFTGTVNGGVVSVSETNNTTCSGRPVST